MSIEQKVDKLLELSIKNDVRCDEFEKRFDKLDETHEAQTKTQATTFKSYNDRITVLENKGKKTVKQHILDASKVLGTLVLVLTIIKLFPQVGKILWP